MCDYTKKKEKRKEYGTECVKGPFWCSHWSTVTTNDQTNSFFLSQYDSWFGWLGGGGGGSRVVWWLVTVTKLDVHTDTNVFLHRSVQTRTVKRLRRTIKSFPLKSLATLILSAKKMNQSYRVVSATHSQLWRSCHWSCGGSHPARPPVPRWEGEHVLHRQPPIDTPRHPLRGNRTTRLTQLHCVESRAAYWLLTGCFIFVRWKTCLQRYHLCKMAVYIKNQLAPYDWAKIHISADRTWIKWQKHESCQEALCHPTNGSLTKWITCNHRYKRYKV